MAYLDQEFDASTVETTGGQYDPLPAGWYTAKINSAELKDTKAGNGQYIKVRYDVTGPTHQGRVVFGNLNIKNPNPVAENIGRQQLAELMGAIGITKVRDTDQLVGGECSIKLAVKHDDRYGDSNEVKGFKSISGSMAPAPTATDQPVAAQSAPVGNKAPWIK